MLLFRSEEHIDGWAARRRLAKGAVFSVEQLWGLASIWYRDRMKPEWRRSTAEEAEEVFASLGLTGGFWKLT
jgi:hypothetical protein